MPGALAQPSLKLSCTGGVWDACPPSDHLCSALSSTAPRGCPPSTSPTASAPSAASRSSWTSTRRGSSRTRTASPATTCILLLRASAVPLPSSQHPGARVGDAGRCQRILTEGTFREQSAAPIFWQGSGSVCLVELLQPPLPHNSSGSAACGASSALAAEGGEVSCKSGSAASSQSPGRGQVRGFFPSCDSAVELGCSLLLTP